MSLDDEGSALVDVDEAGLATSKKDLFSFVDYSSDRERFFFKKILTLLLLMKLHNPAYLGQESVSERF